MNKLSIFILLVVCICSSLNSVFAQTVFVSEIVPGADCQPVYRDASGKALDQGTAEQMNSTNGSGKVSRVDNVPVYQRKYECTIQPGLEGFQNMFATIIRWLINIVLLVGVLAIVGLGIAWSLAGGDDAKAKSELKKWAINILVGLIILFFFQYILKFLAPWIYT